MFSTDGGNRASIRKMWGSKIVDGRQSHHITKREVDNRTNRMRGKAKRE